MLHTCFKNCKDYIYDEFKDIYTKDTRINCTEMEPLDERFLMCVYPEHECEKTIVANEIGWGQVKIAIYEGFIAMAIATPI